MDGSIPVWFIALGWMLVVTALFLMRPASLRRDPDTAEKRNGAPPGSNGNGNGNGNDRQDPPAIF